MRHLYDALTVIGTPAEIVADCRTHAKYVDRHMREMAAKQAKFPSFAFAPHVVTPAPVPFIVCGKWVVLCACGDAPIASPAWDEARCLQCGAIYHGLSWPSERAEIEAALVARPRALLRTWVPGETLADILAQNAEHGVV